MGYIYVWEHFRGGRHIDVDWSPTFEDLYSPELDFMDICVIRNPLGCQGSACVEVMTTLHGSAPSLRRRAEGCVPSKGGYRRSFASAMALIQGAITSLGQRIDGQQA
ncbi:hypothetical protein AAG906_038424 [Vitis piasezkii]